MDETAIAQSKVVDGVFPLVTNTRLEAKEVLAAYKFQPNIEKHFATIKSDFEAAPIFLKSTERIEAFMFVVYLADLVGSIVQREIRRAMAGTSRKSIRTLPEQRESKTPTWEQVQRLFGGFSRFELTDKTEVVKTFTDQLTNPQEDVLKLLGMPATMYQ